MDVSIDVFVYMAKYRITDMCSVETHIHFLVPPHSFSYIYISNSSDNTVVVSIFNWYHIHNGKRRR